MAPNTPRTSCHAGGGRLALSVRKALLRIGGVSVGDAADFEIELAAAATELS